ncbi:FAD-dependent monooxygenase [Streptomyces sp. NPDC093085]|uniref:FAD-dependent oxidoreductase n=1 Tax=Streptomyces sp. NPDC093085 TaxID=3155068 RepID=UPI00341BD7A6
MAELSGTAGDTVTSGGGGGGRGARHAVVVGGSIAGLLAARVLTNHADRVTVIERDRYPEGPEPRAGVPQGRHVHVLLESGQRALEELLPGFLAELRDHGAPRIGMPGELLQWQAGRFFRRTPSSAYLLTGSRPLLEWLVRRRVLADPRITVVPGTEVVGLAGDPGRVRGVRLRERGAGGRQDVRTLTADLVVDASGRATRSPEWLTELGVRPPGTDTLDTGLAYASRYYRAPEPPPGPDCLGYFFVSGRQHAEGGGILPAEGGRYLVTLSGLRGTEPPSDEAAFLGFAARLPHPSLHTWLTAAEPETPVHTFRSAGNVRRRYDTAGPQPAGFLATGDALCFFNPVYGQGMSVAALDALALDRALADPRRTPTTRRVQLALLRTSRQAWDIASGADRGIEGVRGSAVRVHPAQRPAAWYLERVLARAPGDPVIGDAFRSVTHLNAPPGVLFTPRVARAVLFDRPRPDLPGPQQRQEAAGPPGQRRRSGESEPVRYAAD